MEGGCEMNPLKKALVDDEGGIM